MCVHAAKQIECVVEGAIEILLLLTGERLLLHAAVYWRIRFNDMSERKMYDTYTDFCLKANIIIINVYGMVRTEQQPWGGGTARGWAIGRAATHSVTGGLGSTTKHDGMDRMATILRDEKNDYRVWNSLLLIEYVF